MVLDLNFILILALAFLIICAVAYVFFYNSISGKKRAEQRMKRVQTDRKTKAKVQSKKMDEKARRKMREESMKLVEKQAAKDKKTSNPPLSVKLVQADISITVKTFWMICGGAFVLSFFMGMLFVPQPIYYILPGALVVGVGLPHWFVSFKRKRRFKKFTLAFPNAIDVIVRGIKSGLPLNDCIRIISQDAEEPVRSEFRKLIEATHVGMTVPEAAERMALNIPTSETSFFAIVLNIQSSAGGNLSEALGNLSKVLRERRKMSDKIKGVSAEAKTSAGIIGSLPFVVAVMVTISQPGYLDPLFVTELGNKILVGCALSMGFGIFVMKKMINFNF